MHQLAIIELPAFSKKFLKYAPKLSAFADKHQLGSLTPELPAVTMPGHASLSTGTPISDHGVIANGWYFREHNDVMMWRQSEKLIQAETIWDAAKKRNEAFKSFKHFWWPGMASSTDIYCNVRPAYFADGRKSGDIYCNKSNYSTLLQEKFGTFPLFNFWGPASNIKSSEWIANTAKFIIEKEQPDLSLIYLPHLDYKQQVIGPNDPAMKKEVEALDNVLDELVQFLEKQNIRILILSSYHMNQVDKAIPINKIFREKKLLKVIKNPTGELIDFAESQAFAVADHQFANVYIKNQSSIQSIQSELKSIDGINLVLDKEEQKSKGLSHKHTGDLMIFADKNAWFNYYYWLDEQFAPDFARTVAIHAKPGYDPCELIVDPNITMPKLKIATKLIRKKMGFRYTMDLIPIDSSLIKGSHGLLPDTEEEVPILISTDGMLNEKTKMTDIKDIALKLIFD